MLFPQTPKPTGPVPKFPIPSFLPNLSVCISGKGLMPFPTPAPPALGTPTCCCRRQTSKNCLPICLILNYPPSSFCVPLYVCWPKAGPPATKMMSMGACLWVCPATFPGSSD